MTNTELTKIREDKKLSKKEFAALLGVTPMLLGRYEKGTCAIPESVAEKLTATEIDVKKTVREGGRKAKEAAEDIMAEVKEAVEDKIVAEEIEVKKTVRKAGRKAKEIAQSDAVAATEIEVKKNVRKAGRKAKEKAEEAAARIRENAKKAAGVPNIIIQSPMGGYITFEDIARKVPYGTADVYVRVDENKLYYVLENGDTGDIDIWE